jgi:hypothetical protein
MNLFPFLIKNYHIDKNEELILMRLKLNTEPLNYLRQYYVRERFSKTFEGYIENNSFRINRILNYRYGFYPVITGKVINNEIKVKIRPLIFLLVIICIMIIIFLELIFSAVFYHDLSSIYAALPLLVFYVFILILFNLEKKNALKEFERLLE